MRKVVNGDDASRLWRHLLSSILLVFLVFKHILPLRSATSFVLLQKISSELSEHQRLLRSVQRQGSGLQLLDNEPKPPDVAEQERMIANQWTDLARQARDRNEQLKQALDMSNNKVSDAIKR